MKPAIGINLNQEGNRFTLRKEYWEAVSGAGGIPVVIPPLMALDDVDRVLESLDGLLLTGGGDIEPARYGERPAGKARPVPQPKHDSDFQLAARAIEFGIPTLGVCYGMQLLAVLHGGKLVQDIPASIKTSLDHWGSPDKDAEHPVRLSSSTAIHGILGCETLLINSHHHQSVGDPGTLVVTARAEDGVAEAVELKDFSEKWVLGVQWHPERMSARAQGLAVYRALIDAASRYSEGSGFDVTIVR